MNRNVKYRYNPDTDNFERIYPSWRSRMAKILLFLLCSIGAGVLMMVVFFYSFGTPTEENLRRKKRQPSIAQVKNKRKYFEGLKQLCKFAK